MQSMFNVVVQRQVNVLFDDIIAENVDQAIKIAIEQAESHPEYFEGEHITTPIHVIVGDIHRTISLNS